jgi:hypothetical protein
MPEYNIDDLIERNAPEIKERNVEDVLSNLGEYKPEEQGAEETLKSEFGKKAKGLVSKVGRGMELLGRGAAQTVPSTVAGFAAGGPVGGLLGSVAIPFGDTLNSIINRVAGTNLRMPSEVISTGMSKLGYAEPKTEAGRIAEAAGGGLGGATSELSNMYNLAKTATNPIAKNIAEQFTKEPVRQLAVAPVATAGGQATTEETGSPFAGLLASLGIGAAGGLSMTKKATNAPTHEDLVLESKNLFDKAKSSGVEFDPNQFSKQMGVIGKNLRQEGYTPTAYPGIAAVIDELQNPNMPKDFTELQALRKMIQGQQKSTDPQTRMLATSLKDDFDDYVINSTSHMTKGTPQATKDWADARNSYSRLKKSEIFDDMLSNAELDQNKFTQSGAENSLAMQLRNLSKNDKKMRTFTSEEQDAIREAAKGGSVQKLLKFYGRFAPTGPVSSIFSGGATALNPLVGVPFAVGAAGSRMAATALRKNAVENLGAQMRLGQKPELTSRTQNVPITTLQSLIAQPQQLNMNYIKNIGNEQ